MGVKWTAERIEMLGEMLRAKKTYAEIAERLGVSRSAAAGAATRFYPTRHSHNRDKTACIAGHPLAGENLYIRSDGSRECRMCKREKRMKPCRTNPVKCGTPSAPVPPPRPCVPAPAQVMAADGKPITLRTLDRGQCRFIVNGEGLRAEYCGNATRYFGRAWCEFHQRVVYQAGTAPKFKPQKHRRVSGPVMAEMITR